MGHHAGMTTIIEGISGLKELVGQHLGYSDYVEMTQQQVIFRYYE